MKKILLAVIEAAAAAAAFFLYSLATVELPELEIDSSVQAGHSGVAPLPGQPESAPSPAPADPEATEPSPDLAFLSQEQQDVFSRAQETVIYLADPSNLAFQTGNDSGGEVLLEGRSYLLITGQDENYQDFRARMRTIFTERCLEQLDFDARFRSRDGQLAALVGGVGGAIDYAECPDTYRLESADDDAVIFTLIGHYIQQQPEETDTDFLTRRAGGAFDSTMEFSIRLVNSAEGWRMDEFHSPRFPYTF
ncbi:hypothetical protein [Candidatus Allofournierella merdavium]|uniref:hypothetical protein n=1 Tax=Candidatus Allofournierella merdavium TaxID=2838593 RepID=UPI00374F641E